MLLPHMTFELSFVGEGLPQKSDEQQLFLQKKVCYLTKQPLICTAHAYIILGV